MAQAEDLDMNIDGFEPEDNFTRVQRRTRAAMNAARATARTVPTAVAVPPAPETHEADSDASASQAQAEAPAPPQSRVKKKPKQKSNRPNIFVRFFTDERLRIFLGIALILSCVFVVIALVSYFKTGALDQSLVLNSTFAEMAAGGQIQNLGGGFGAWLTHVMLCDSLGLGSAVLIIYAWLLAMGLLGFKKCHFWSLTFKCLLVGITISMVLGLVTFNSESVIHWGGTHGYYANKFLMDNATWIGAACVSALLVAAVACVYLNELHTAWIKWREAVYRRRLQEQLRKERQRDLEDAVAAEEESRAAAAAEAAEKATETQEENETAQRPSMEVVVTEADDAAKPIAEGFSLVPEAHATIGGRQLQDIADYDEPGFAIDSPADHVQQETPEAKEIKAPKEEETIPALPQPQAEEFPIEEEPIKELPQAEEPIKDLPQAEEEEPPALEEFTVEAAEIELADKIAKTPENPSGIYDHRAELSRYRFPSIDLLEDRKSGAVIDMEEQQANKDRIVKTLGDYNIPISRIEATVGPTVTLYEVVPAEGVRISQIKRLEDDIALSLSALGIRIIAPIPGKGTVGIEVPNRDPQTVSMRSVIASKKFQECKMALPMAMGATISNDIFIADMAKMPHMLVAGATGMGKSVGLNAIIASLLYKKHPTELKFVLIDPKMVEFSLYSRLERHYLAKLPDEDDAIITDMGKVIQTLNSLCVEMDDRYALLRKAGVRSLEEYNKKFTERRLLPSDGHKYLPYIVVIVDEFADLIMTAGKEVETPIARIAQKARAVGIHMIIATQRPSTNVITGIIKANFPGRIAFRVIQMVDSRTILDSPGANQLIGRGDMLFSHNGSMERVQCAFISTEEVESIIQSIDQQVGFEHAYYLPEYIPEGAEGAAAGANTGERDALFDEAARFVVQRQIGSTSSLQRQFNIGYNRAGRLMDQMEAAGIIGPVNGSKPRAILMDSMSLEQMLGQ
ncbi:MAG: DNA translocase FtsK [Bacteroidales bacterium]|nr:DNA translocase FtsK [Bacteroidales bacterium]